jgi:hypothetical protein
LHSASVINQCMGLTKALQRLSHSPLRILVAKAAFLHFHRSH